MSLNRDNRSSRPASPREGWRRAMAVMLTGVLSFEAAFGNGLSTALADNVSGGGLSYSQIAAGQTPDPDASQDNGSTEKNDGTTPTTPTPDNSPYDWTGDALHLVLGSDGLELDLDKAKESLPEPTDPSGDADEQASLLELLPETLPATLNLSFELDPTLADEAEQPASPAEVDPGDTFTVSLPEGMTLSSDEPADVFAADEQGEPTTIAIAEAQASEDGSSVKVTFVEPHDTAAAEDTTNETPAGDELSLLTGEGEGEELDPADPADPAKRGTVDLDVQFGRDKLADAEQSLTWTLQAGTDDGDEPQTAALLLPSVEELAKSLGVSAPTESGDGEDDEASQPSQNTIQGRSVAYGDKPATTVAANGSTTTELVSHWMDNNNADDLRPELESLKARYVFEFKIGEQRYTFKMTNAMEQLGWTEEQWQQYLDDNGLDADGPYIVFSALGNTYTASAAGLPTERVTTTWQRRTNDEGKPIFETDPINPDAGPVAVWDSVETTEDITWQIVDGNSYGPNHQVVTKEGDETNRYFQPLTPNEFNIVGKVGAEDFDVMAADTDDHLWVEILVDGKPVQDGDGNLRISLAQDQDWNTHFQDKDGNQYWLSKNWQLTAEGTTSGTLTVTGPAYTLDDKVIEYRLVYEPASNDGLNEDGTYDYYDDTYDNAASANHGGNTTELYAGGTLYFTHRGTTTFGAYKAWLDNGNEYGTRKDVSFTLVRYAYKGEGSSAANAAQVTDKNGSFITITLKANEKDKYLMEGSDGTYDLGALLADQLKATGTTLEKYDPDGYPYIYALRESAVLDDYRTKYGTVDDTGSVDDDRAPNYQNEESTAAVYPTRDASWFRGTDTLIYNTGTISNQLYDTVATSATKSWDVSSFADQLKDVTCTFTLKCAVLNEDGTHDDWENAKSERGQDITQTLKGFSAEQLEQTFTYYAPLYNADGEKLTYRWIETSVQQGDGEPQQITMNDENVGEFKLTLHPVDGGEEDVTLPFFSRWTEGEENSLGAKGPDKIENYFQSEAEQHIEKVWADSDMEKPESITLLLYRNFDLLATITLGKDGMFQGVEWEDEDFQGFDEEKCEYTGENPRVSVPKGDPWHVDIDNLPQYSERGGAYVYRVFEGSVPGWGSERSYDDETKTTTIVNSPWGGVKTRFHLMKEWVDDADTSHQLSTRVNVYAAEDIYDRADVNKGLRDPGEDDTVAVPKDTLIAEGLELSAGQTWFAEFDVNAPEVQMSQLKVVETELFDPANPEVTYPVVDDAEEALDVYGDNAAYWANRGWDASKYGDNQHPRAATKDHVYEVTIDEREDGGEGTFGSDMFVVNNRRIGLVDLTVQKTWVDEGAKADERPDASFRLACDDAGATFATKTYTIDGEQVDCVVIKLTAGNELPIFKSSATSDKPYDHLLAREATIIDGENGAEDAVLVVSANKTGESGVEQVQGFYGLPKYNGKGEIVHYTVEEVWDSPSDHGDYVSVKNTLQGEDAYKVNDLHFHDEQTESFTNRRTATTSVTFYKQWNDYYVNDVIGQRPDIRLSLYQVSGENGTLKEVAGSPVFVWQEIGGSGTSSEAALDGPKYNQKCTVSNLPKYDSNGAEITYYAQEHMLSNGAALDYVKVSFDNKHLGTDVSDPLYKLDEDDVAASTAVESWPTDLDSLYEGENNEDAVYVIRQDGTFVNELSNTVTVRGTKRWGNTAGVVESEDDLPGIMLILQQRLQGSDGEDDAWPGVKLQQATSDDGTVSYVPVAVGGEPGGCLAWTTAFDNNWNYSMSHTGMNAEDDNQVTDELPEGTTRLPKYDDNGQLYEYRVVEVMVGLIDTEGGLPWSELEGKDLNQIDLHESNKVFEVEDSNTGQYTISNNYDPVKTSLTVKKILTGLSEDDTVYPEVELTLYRSYEKGKDGAGLSTPVAVGDPVKISAFGEVSDGTATGTYAFENVDVFAPNGSRWHYYVVETPVDGYPTVRAGAGDLSIDDTELTQATAAEDPVTGATVGWESPTIQLAAPAEGAENNENVDLTFSNAYEPGEGLTLTGTKAWDDQSNAFDLRPELELNKNLKLTRTTDGMTTPEEVELAEGEDGNFTWNKTDGNKWTFTIMGLEQWAPNGKPWTYTITEVLGENQVDYVIENNNPKAQGKAQPAGDDGTVTYKGSFSAITNRLAASATVQKVWDPATDPWGLQPGSVTVELQARVKNGAAGDDGAPTWGAWGNVNNVLDDYAAVGTTAPIAIATPELNQGNGWKSSWTGLPTQVKSADGNQRYDVQYRVIETKVGNETATISTQNEDTIDPTGDTITLDYERVLSYKGKGVTTLSQHASVEGTGANRSLSATVITNTLEGTSLKVTKVWQDDGNKWGTRPTAQDNTLTDYWHVEYYLQRTTGQNPGDGDWAFVKDASGGYVTGSVTSADMDVETATATFGGLPKYDEAGAEYRYRVLEAAPAGYGVVDATQYTPTGGDAGADEFDGKTLWVVNFDSDGGDVAGQTFTNSLNYINFSGTKTWDDHETGLAPTAPEAGGTPTLSLQRTTAERPEEKDWETVTYVGAEGKDVAPVPTWTVDQDNVWTWTYTGLPQKDAQGDDYTYRVKETASVPGFSIGQGTSVGAVVSAGQGGAVTTQDEGADPDAGTHQPNADQVGAPALKNEATRFTFDKVNDEDPADKVWNVELAVVDAADPTKVFAIWHRDESGTTTSYVWQDGIEVSELWTDGDWKTAHADVSAEKPQDATVMEGDNAGFIIGLKADTYTVIETGPLSKTEEDNNATVHHARLAPFQIRVGRNADGSDVALVTTTDSATCTVTEGLATIAAVDPIFRAHFEFTKYLSGTGEGLEGVEFKLQRKNTSGEYEDVAEGITTDAKGLAGSTGATSIELKASARDAEHTHLSDGLIPGDYRLVEVSVPEDLKDSIYWDNNESNRTTYFTITEKDQGPRPIGVGKSGTISNPAFNARVSLKKHDDVDGGTRPLEGAVFELYFRAAGSTDEDAWVQQDGTYETDANGVLTVTLSRKGQYRLVEVENPGYKLDAENRPTVEFVLENEDHQATDADPYDLTKAEVQTNLSVKASNIAHQESPDTLGANGIPNHRLPGEVTLRKVDAALLEDGPAYGIDGTTFTLQRQKDDGSWEDFATGLKTGYAYAYDQEKNAMGACTANAESVPSGTLKVRGLPWGTYKFVETAPAPGYEGQTPDGAVIESKKFVIGADADKQNGNSITTAMGDEAISVELPALENNKTGIDLVKLNTANNDQLAGATFTLVPADGSTFNDANPTEARTFTTGDVGKATIPEGLLIVGNSYTISETAAPAGYELMEGSFTFTVKADGTIEAAVEGTEAAEDALGYRVGADRVTLEATDEPIDLLVTKQGEGGAALAGAEFKIVPQGAGDAFVASWLKDNELKPSEEDGSVTLVTNAGGRIDLTGALIQGKVYTLVETAAPTGYEVVAPLTFQVGADGSLTPGTLDADDTFTATEGLPGGYALSADGVLTLTVTDSKIGVQIEKRGIGGAGLSGATFTIEPATDAGAFDDSFSPAEGSGVVIDRAPGGGPIQTVTVTSGEDGRTPSLVGLFKAGNSYVVTETVAPAGYEPAGSAIITVGADGTLSVTSKGDGTDTFMTADGAGVATLIVNDEPIAIQVVKAAAGNLKSWLSGAEFTITPEEGSAFADPALESYVVTTGADGIATVAGVLKAGNTYTIRETKPPAGYETNPGSLTFTVSEQGTISTDDPTSAYPWYAIAYDDADEAVAIMATDTPIELQLRKLNLSEEPLVGAVFEIRGVFANGSTSVRVGPTDEDGYVELPSGMLIAGETYTIEEVTAPAGYQRLGEFTFGVTGDGVFEAEATSTGSAAAGDLTAGYRLSADGLTLVAVDAPQQGGGDPDDPDDPDPEEPDDPDDPEDPDDPDEPEDPDEPDDPDDPGEPEEPGDPDEPGEPEEPGKPGEPSEPGEPGEPEKPGEPSEEVPDAGDHTNVGLPVALMLAGVVLVTSATLVLRRRGQNR